MAHGAAEGAAHPGAVQLERPLRRRPRVSRDGVVSDRLLRARWLERTARLPARRVGELPRAGLGERHARRRARRRTPAVRVRHHAAREVGRADAHRDRRGQPAEARPRAGVARSRRRVPRLLPLDHLRLLPVRGAAPPGRALFAARGAGHWRARADHARRRRGDGHGFRDELAGDGPRLGDDWRRRVASSGAADVCVRRRDGHAAPALRTVVEPGVSAAARRHGHAIGRGA